ncbi:serine/threonine protein kinase [Candidatus Binatus sp.]|uniref:serine/threonine protein kinase n=1 Tax=Candidatus Binatus sp. TaxID=2811406 RepID=UPI003C6950FE
MNGLNAIDLVWLRQQFPRLSNLNPLSVGGQKLVFAGVHPIDGEVVLKLIHPRQDHEQTRRELLAVSQVNSERVPSILEVGTMSTPVGDCSWFRERKIAGKTVRELLVVGPLSISDLLRLGLHTLEALLDAEQAKIVHRDVKPENIIRDNSGSFWLIDFGIARHLDLDSITATVSAFGKFTVGYAPQEQYRNVKTEIDARCDLFALGVTLYECATGRNPFADGARDAMEQLTRVETMPLPRLSLTFANAQKFADLVAAMTQKRRDHRPSTVREAYDWMKEICDAEGI